MTDNNLVKNSLNELRAYVCSEKFVENEYIHKNDVLLRVNEILSLIE